MLKHTKESTVTTRTVYTVNGADIDRMIREALGVPDCTPVIWRNDGLNDTVDDIDSYDLTVTLAVEKSCPQPASVDPADVGKSKDDDEIDKLVRCPRCSEMRKESHFWGHAGKRLYCDVCHAEIIEMRLQKLGE